MSPHPNQNAENTDYDGPWKEALEIYFQDFMEFFFPEAYESIDWSRGYEFLDKEFQKIIRDAELGKRLADKLVRVWLKDQQAALVLIHLEIQSQYEADFTERMFVYNYRIFDSYRLPVATLVVLADNRPNWTPQEFSYQLWGSETQFRFPSVKLLDYQSQWEQLEQETNPFAVMVMAHLKSQATRQQPNERLKWKLEVTKSLYRRGYSRQDILELFRLVNWLMNLPEELERSFNTEIANYEEDQKMPYITPLERFAQEKGLEQGLEQGALRRSREAVFEILTARFTAVPNSLTEGVNQLDDVQPLKALLVQAATLPSLEAFEEALQQLLSDSDSD